MVTFPVLVKLLDVSFICHVQNLYIPWPFFRFPSLVSILSLNPYYAWERLGTLGMPVILLLVAGNRAKQCG